MLAKLSTHVLDLTIGRPAVGMKIQLWRHTDKAELVKTVVTNADGRTDAPLLEGIGLSAGDYELDFYVRHYFAARKVPCDFLDRVPIRFYLADATANYHVPLLVSPWAYSTYRGS